MYDQYTSLVCKEDLKYKNGKMSESCPNNVHWDKEGWKVVTKKRRKKKAKMYNHSLEFGLFAN